MGLKTNKCCCCPPCTVDPGECCQCICTTLCVTLDPYGSGSVDQCIKELQWNADERNFNGIITCESADIDLLFRFESDDEGCWFVVESGFLNFGTGSGSEFVPASGTGTGPDIQRHRWLVGADVQCSDLTASVSTDRGILSVRCATKVTPSNCTGCECVCGCLCVTYQRPCCYKIIHACWNAETLQYEGSAVCGDGVPVTVIIKFKPANQGIPEDDPQYDPSDTSCVAVVYINQGSGTGSQLEPFGWYRPPCPDMTGEVSGFVSGTGTGSDDVEKVTVACGNCGCVDDCDTCIQNGSIIPTCPNCADGVPLLLHTQVFDGCVAGFYELGAMFATECRWTSTGLDDTDLHVEGLDCGEVRLVFTLPDTTVVVYRNVEPWRCLCSNRMRISYAETTADCSDADEYICVDPVPSCCAADRDTELPPVLYATFVSDTACTCAESSTIPITWNPSTNKWEGSGRFGTCDSVLGGQRTVSLQLYCASEQAAGCDSFTLDVQLVGELCTFPEVAGGDTATAQPGCTCDPLDLEFGPFLTDTCCDLVGGPGNSFSVIISE